MTEYLIDKDQGGFRSGRRCVDQIFTLNQIGEKARKKKKRVYGGFMEKTFDGVNKEALWQFLGMYDVGGTHLSGIKSIYVSSMT